MKRTYCLIGLIGLAVSSLSPVSVSAAAKHKKAVSLEEQVLSDLTVLHQADSDVQDQIATEEYLKSQRSLLVTEHHALPPASQEPQHLSLEQRHEDFINRYTVRIDTMRGQLQAHADEEKAIRAKQMKWTDAADALKKWKTETDAMLTQLKGFSDEFAQIGQDYLDIFQDHHSAPPAETDHLIHPPGAAH